MSPQCCDTHLNEILRLRFVCYRDGLEGAVRFAEQAFMVYRKHLKLRNQAGRRHGYSLAFRHELVASCVVFRRFLRDNSIIN